MADVLFFDLQTPLFLVLERKTLANAKSNHYFNRLFSYFQDKLLSYSIK